MRLFLIIIMLLATQMSWAETEAQTIARVIAAEACGEGFLGMSLVAEVIANRAMEWSKTPYQIVTAKNQFYGYTAPNSHRLYAQCQQTADRLATAILTGQTGQKTKGALYFRQPKEKRMSWHVVEVARHKGHIFYR